MAFGLLQLKWHEVTAIQVRPATAKKNTTEEKERLILALSDWTAGFNPYFEFMRFLREKRKSQGFFSRKFNSQLSDTKPSAVLQVGFKEGVIKPIQGKIYWI